jgi:hypothetical protein
MDNQNITQEPKTENLTEIKGIGDSIYSESITAIKKAYNPGTQEIEQKEEITQETETIITDPVIEIKEIKPDVPEIKEVFKPKLLYSLSLDSKDFLADISILYNIMDDAPFCFFNGYMTVNSMDISQICLYTKTWNINNLFTDRDEKFVNEFDVLEIKDALKNFNGDITISIISRDIQCTEFNMVLTDGSYTKTVYGHEYTSYTSQGPKQPKLDYITEVSISVKEIRDALKKLKKAMQIHIKTGPKTTFISLGDFAKEEIILNTSLSNNGIEQNVVLDAFCFNNFFNADMNKKYDRITIQIRDDAPIHIISKDFEQDLSIYLAPRIESC